jgi:hypothetical protein
MPMKLIGFLCLLVLIGTLLSAGCFDACKSLNIGCEDYFSKVYVSHDPQACKSITVDCSKYGYGGYFDKEDVRTKYAPFSDSSGCGCEAYTGGD